MSHSGLPHDAVVYPTSDGQPMAETEIHGACMMYAASALRWWFKKHGRDDVYVGSNNFLYYERGNRQAVVSPDVYVVVGAPAGLRDTRVASLRPVITLTGIADHVQPGITDHFHRNAQTGRRSPARLPDTW